MGTCCGYVNQKQDKEKTVYTTSINVNREKEIQECLEKINDDNQNETRLHPQDKNDDQGETSSFLYGSMLQNNIHSMIQNHGTMDQDDNEKYKKEPFYGAEALADYITAQTVDLNLQNIANEEVTPLKADQIGIEVQEHKKLVISNSKEIKELEKKKSELVIIKQDTLQPNNKSQEKDLLLRRASQQFEQQSTLLKQQQQQLIQQQQLLEKQQQIIQQQMQQQMLVQQQLNYAQAQKQAQQQQQQTTQPQQNPTNQTNTTQSNNPSEKGSTAVQKAGANLPPLKKPVQQTTAVNNAPQSPQLSARGRKPENDVNSSFDSAGTAKSVDKPRSIMKRKNNDLNSSFASDADSQKSKQKKKVKFKESVFKKQSKKKKSGVISFNLLK